MTEHIDSIACSMAEQVSAVLREIETVRCCLKATRQATGQLTPLLTADPGTSAGRCQAFAVGLPNALRANANLPECAFAAGPESVRFQLERARQAVQATTAASASPAEDEDGGAVHRQAAAAASALTFVTAAVTTPGRYDLGVEASAAQDLLKQLAQNLSRWQQRRALASAEAAQHAAAAGDLDAVAPAAVCAKEHVAMAMWAACLGGPQALQELSGDLDAANRAADGALLLSRDFRSAPDPQPSGASVLSPPQPLSAPSPPPASCCTASLPADPEAAVARGPADNTAAAEEPASGHQQGGALSAAASAAGMPNLGRTPMAGAEGPQSSSTCSSGAAAPGAHGATAANEVGCCMAVAHEAAVARPAASTSLRPGMEPAAPLFIFRGTTSPATSTAAVLPPAPAAAFQAAAPVSAASMDASSSQRQGCAATALPTAATSESHGAQSVDAQVQPGDVSEAAALSATMPSAACSDGASAPKPTGPTTLAAPECEEPRPRAPGAPAKPQVPGPSTADLQKAREKFVAPLLPPRAASNSSSGSVGRAGGADAPRGEPPNKAPDPLAADVGVLQVAMRRLVQAADQTCEDGELRMDMAATALEPIVNRSETGSACQKDEVVKVAAVWADPPTRCAVLQLMSCTVRQMCALPALEVPPPMSTSASLARVLGCITQFLKHLLDNEASVVQRKQALQLLVRTDTVQCLVGSLALLGARAAAELRRSSKEPGAAEVPVCDPRTTSAALETASDGDSVAAVGLATRDVDVGASHGQDSETTYKGGRLDVLMSLQVAFTQIHILLLCLVETFLEPGLREEQRDLQGVFLRSQALEHMARTTVLVRHHGRAQSGERETVESNIPNLLASVENLLVGSLAGLRPAGVFANVLLSGPCAQYFLLLHAVSQLCAADGGPDYGLPPGARLPVVTSGPDGSIQHFKAAMAEQGTSQATTDATACDLQQPLVPKCHLLAKVMTSSFSWWASHRARPCSDRALRAVCERAAAAALAVTAAACTSPPDPASAGGSGVCSDVGDRGAAPRFAAADAVPLALASLECAVTLVLKGSAGSLRRLWAPVVQAVNAAELTTPTAVEMFGRNRPFELLVMLPLPPLQPGAGPGPDLAPVLAAGYAATLERTVRSEIRQVTATELSEGFGILVEKLKSLSRLLGRGPGLVNLLAHEELRTSVSLMSSIVKVLNWTHVLVLGGIAARRMGNSTCSALAAAEWMALGQVFDVASKMIRALVSGSGGSVRPQPPGVMAGASGGAEAGPGTRSKPAGDGAGAWGEAATGGSSRGEAGSSQGSSAADGSPSGGSGGGGGSCVGSVDVGGGQGPTVPGDSRRQLSFLAALFLTHWLPGLQGLMVKASVIMRLELSAASPAFSSALFCATLAVQAYLSCREAAEGQWRSVKARPESSDGDGGSGGCVGRSAVDADADAEAWAALLLGPLDMPGLVAQAACMLGSANFTSSFLLLRAAADSMSYTQLVESVVVAMQHILVVFPARLTSFRDTSLLDTVVRICERHRFDEVDTRAKHFVELAAAFKSGKRPGPEDLLRLRGNENTELAAMAASLPPPRELKAALRQLPLCGDPHCTNMAGDSERDLPLPIAGKGSVRYCSKCGNKQHRSIGMPINA